MMNEKDKFVFWLNTYCWNKLKTYLELHGGSKTNGVKFMKVEFFNKFQSELNTSYFYGILQSIADKTAY